MDRKGSRGAPLFQLSILSSMLFDALPQAEEDRCCWRTVEGTVISMLPSEDETIGTKGKYGKVMRFCHHGKC